eukprot:745816-Hanusia_phi.AAC.2
MCRRSSGTAAASEWMEELSIWRAAGENRERLRAVVRWICGVSVQASNGTCLGVTGENARAIVPFAAQARGYAAIAHLSATYLWSRLLTLCELESNEISGIQGKSGQAETRCTYLDCRIEHRCVRYVRRKVGSRGGSKMSCIVLFEMWVMKGNEVRGFGKCGISLVRRRIFNRSELKLDKSNRHTWAKLRENIISNNGEHGLFVADRFAFDSFAAAV